MGKKLEYTPNSQIKSVLRRLFLRSRERSKRLKLDDKKCVVCGVKQSKAKGYEQKVEVHHIDGVVNWDEMYSVIRKYLLCDVDQLETLCPDCHSKQHGSQKGDNGNNGKYGTKK